MDRRAKLGWFEEGPKARGKAEHDTGHTVNHCCILSSSENQLYVAIVSSWDPEGRTAGFLVLLLGCCCCCSPKQHTGTGLATQLNLNF
jgi:hypothetical protein